MGKGKRQLSLERSDEVAPHGGGRVWCALTADQHNAGGECVGADTDRAGASLSAHRPSTGDCKPGADDRVEEGLPATARRAGLALALRLLEGVVDGDWEVRVRRLDET